MNDDLISRSALKQALDWIINNPYVDADREIMEEIDNAPTVDTTCPNCDSGYAQGYTDGYLKGKEERPQGERAERALAIIDRLRTDGHINNKEQGTLRRAILLPDRPHGVWEELATNPPNFLGHRFYICSKCNRGIDVITPDETLDDYPYCHCGACMIKEAEK